MNAKELLELLDDCSPKHRLQYFEGLLQHKRIAELEKERDQLREALVDCRGGLVYIRQSHGDLYGVGFDRAIGKADKALKQEEQE